jgi:prevent-host-death family protein
MAAWQVQQAKSRFSKLLKDAHTVGPQYITSHGTQTAVVVSIEDFEKNYTQPREPKLDLRDFLLNAPKLFTDEEHDEIFGNLRDPNDTGRNVDSIFEDDEEDAA